VACAVATRDELERAFWESIREAPEDDVPRLVYSDWLEENGQPQRAELIRVQCQLARLPAYDERAQALWLRSHRLICTHRAEWVGPLEALATGRYSDWGISVALRRGLPEHLDTDAGEFLEHAGELFRLAPLRSVHIHEGANPALAECAWLARLDALGLTIYGNEREVLRGVLGSEYLSGLRELRLKGDRLRDEAGFAPASAGHLRRLSGLSLESLNLGAAGLRALAEAPHLSGLTRLSLKGPYGLGAGIEALASASFLPNLRELELGRCGVADSELRFLAGCAGLSGLCKLRVANPYCDWKVGPQGARALAAGRLSALAELDLSEHAIGDEGAAALAGSAALSRLEVLKLDRNGIGPAGARALAASKHLSGLRALDLGQNRIGGEGLSALAASPHLAGLRALDIHANEISDSGVKTLAASEHLTNLVSLDLQYNRFGDEGVRSLARSGGLGRLRVLLLFNDKLTAASADALIGSSALPNVCSLSFPYKRLAEPAATAGESLRRPGLIHAPVAGVRVVFLPSPLGGERSGVRGLARCLCFAGDRFHLALPGKRTAETNFLAASAWGRVS
jgi:uncharacterized protein (TIGR02996 family)